MQFDLHATYLGDAQPPVVEEAPVAFWLRIREAVVPTLPLEAWVTRLLTCLDAAKEGAKGQIDTLLKVGDTAQRETVITARFGKPMGKRITAKLLATLEPVSDPSGRLSGEATSVSLVKPHSNHSR